MVVLPTEKRFDWQHTPFVLIAIVFANLFLFFFYQSDDDRKFYQALTSYEEGQYVAIEWPKFSEYLESRQEVDLLEESRELFLEEDYQSLSVQILIRPDFSRYLKAHEPEFSSSDARYAWLDSRERIEVLTESISSLDFGLVPDRFSVLSLFSHQFLHGGIMHLMGNMFFLVICGFAVEAAIGHRWFLGLYLLSGVAGGLGHMAFNWNSPTPLVGASGAISGVMAMYLAVFRFKKIEFFYWFFIFVGYFRAPALFILPIYIGNEIYSYLTDDYSNVAFMAHTGGFVAGGLAILLLLRFKPQQVDEQYIEEDQGVDRVQLQQQKVSEALARCQFPQALNAQRQLIKEQGVSFERLVLRYRLGNINPDQQFSDEFIELMSQKNPSEPEAQTLEVIWREHSELQGILDPLKQFKLAMAFTQLPNLACAETMFQSLYELEQPPTNIGVLARKLALANQALKNNAKAQHYEQLAESLV